MPVGAAVVALGGATMGTTWRVLLVAPPGADVAALHAAIVARLDDLVAQMSHWEPGSVLSRFNRAPAGTWTTLPADFAHVIDVGLTVAEASGGAFDPAIGRIVDVWGFGATTIAAAPKPAAIDEARAASGWQRLVRDGARLRQPGGLALDLSGIAKGYAADALADLLRDAGVAHCLVEVGGEFVGRGLRPDGDPWWVDLETARGVALPPIRIALHGIAVATSGNYVRGDHNLDPRTGYAASGGVISASVIHARATAADAWATALTVLGVDEGMAVAERLGLAARLVTRDGTEHLSPALAAMLED